MHARWRRRFRPSSLAPARTMRFGKYEVVEQIGEGGFGVVYKGWDPVLKRCVAIKTCTWDDVEFRRRFVHEAEIAASLRGSITQFSIDRRSALPTERRE